jgi:hypothetical protein
MNRKTVVALVGRLEEKESDKALRTRARVAT